MPSWRACPPATSKTTGLPSRCTTAPAGTVTTGAATLASAVSRFGSRNWTFALISGLSWGSLSRMVTFTWTVALVRSAVGMTWRSTARYLRSGKASTVTSAG